MTKIQTISRSKILLEVLHDESVLNTWWTGWNWTPTNVSYTNTDRWYQKQHWIYGATSTTTFTTVNSTLGCHFRIYPTANNKTVLQLTTTTWLVTISSGNAIVVTGANTPVVYVNNIQTTTITLNTWNDVVITWDSYNCVNPAIWNSSFTGNIWVVRFFNTVLSTQEIQSLYMEGLRKLGGSSLAPLTDGLVAYYDMNGDAQDIIGGNNGTVTGATLTTDRFGNNNKAYSFNWTSNNISLPFTLSWTATIACWFSTTSPSTTARMIATNWVDQSTILWLTTWGKFYSFNYNWGYEFLTSTTTVNTWNWFHWVITLDWTTNGMKMYVNWVLEATDTSWFTASVVWWASWWIWNDRYLNSNWFPWYINEAMFLNRALSASEVLALYQLSSTRYITPLL